MSRLHNLSVRLPHRSRCVLVPFSLSWTRMLIYEINAFVGRDVVQFRGCHSVVRVLWCHHSISSSSALAPSVAIRDESLGQDHQLDAHHRTTVRLPPSLPVQKTLLTPPSSGLKITCKPEEFAVFNAPLGETCVSWANDFVQYFGGYLDNPTESALCRYCPVAVGDEYYSTLNMNFGNRWRDVWLIFVFFGMFFPPTVQRAHANTHLFCSFQWNFGRPRVQIPPLCQEVINKPVTVLRF